MFVERNKVRLDSQTLQKDVHFYHAKFERFFAHNLPWLSCGWFTHKPLIYQFIFICKSCFFFSLLFFSCFDLLLFVMDRRSLCFCTRRERYVAGDLGVAIVPFVTSSQYFERGFVAVLKVAFGFHAGFGWFGRGESNQEVDSLKLCAVNDAKINSRRFSVKWPKAVLTSKLPKFVRDVVFYVRIAHKISKLLKISNSDVFGEMTHDKK